MAQEPHLNQDILGREDLVRFSSEELSENYHNAAHELMVAPSLPWAHPGLY